MSGEKPLSMSGEKPLETFFSKIRPQIYIAIIVTSAAVVCHSGNRISSLDASTIIVVPLYICSIV